MDLERFNSPFLETNSFTYQFTVPPLGPLGLTWKNDLDFGLSLKVQMSKNSPFRNKCKKKFQQQVWIAALHDEEPITVECAIEQLKHL